ncbi:bifunctional glycosyltransferase/CDP-glycerol:glycerophosphate glycerophosphotransferase [Actinacidiphila epipremni]|uniref:Bifunctional glycosyltransferase family 2 protein/CDP-glycerol:glycerophosphate glycerophosphotransferase n=1 Tax=Actinacidiphila epipremni TaxID=2053013 RepID=A0ABX0ZFK1_9ACTN|nr:bifunctional glycosyltransferase family 2 protein/CDP-glycerol:glycerophosphate glycerophosphotransferase [Actinacidiphila epipremni]NJP42081.1 bifunctional glycosyltransferase family 2 protein/CDP-glycerol:glycerophosphate glycerophosphotransferase [Actinacidiphila epipremni]
MPSLPSSPRFSIVVPAYGVEAYLRDCLDSLLDQSFGDFEIIAVDDCSPDACGDIMDEYAAADPRVVSLRLAQNVGLGRARNAGMAKASGTYLLFVDSDDTVLPGALAAIDRRLAETGDPELLVFDYARTTWDGRTVRNKRADVLTSADKPVVTLDEHPQLLDLLQVAWNKAYRRDFVGRWDLEFPPGYYEDTPWTYPVLVAAESIALLDRVCVHYRQRRQGSILHSSSRKHFDVVDQYERVFAFVDAHPRFDRWRPRLYDLMANHYRTVERSPGRLPADAVAEFRTRTAASLAAHLPAGHAPAPAAAPATGGRRAKAGARRLVRRAKKRAAPLKRPLRTAVLRTYYRIQRMLPLQDDLAVFAAYWNSGYTCNPAAVHRKLLELAPRLRTVWVLKNQVRVQLPRGTGRVHPGSFAYWKTVARAKFFVNNVNFPNGVVKRPGQVHLQTHHGTPLKRMGVDLAEFPTALGAMDLTDLIRRVDRWDYSLSANSYSTRIWDRSYPSSYEPLEYGYPRNDVLVTADAAAVTAARRALDLPDGTTVILYMPTHRDYLGELHFPVDLERFVERLPDGHVVLVRGHYYYTDPGRPPAGADAKARLVDVSGHPSVEELYLAADCLLTDYSSAMFDYANLDRPIVVYANDWEMYRTTRGTYFDIHTLPPGPVVSTEDELVALFGSGAWDTEEHTRERARFRARFCEFDDGRAAERVVRRIFLGESAVPPVIPWADRPVPPRP